MRKTWMWVIVAAAALLITGCSNLYRANGLAGDGKLITNDFNINESEYFQDVQRGRQTHLAQILTELNAKAAEVREDNKVEHSSTETNADGTTSTSTWYEYPDVEVIIPDPPLAPAMAYLQLIDENILKGKKYIFNESAILDFYNQVRGEVVVEGGGMSFAVRIEYVPVSGEDYTEDGTNMASKLFPSGVAEYIPNRGYFVDSVKLYETFLLEAGIVTGEGNGSGYNPGTDIGYTGNVVFDETLAGKVCAWATSKVGCSYDQNNRFGESTFDCSSLTYRAYKAYGIDISYHGSSTAAEEARGLVAAKCQVGFEQLEQGDLIFYSTSKNGRYMDITHVAMYIGNGQIVHARNKKSGVRLDPVSYCKSSIRVIARPSGLQ